LLRIAGGNNGPTAHEGLNDEDDIGCRRELGMIATAGAQQVPCKSFYPVGELAPPGCVKAFDKWGDGKPIAINPSPDTMDAYERTFFKPKR
jgi:hypothetical protein